MWMQVDENSCGLQFVLKGVECGCMSAEQEKECSLFARTLKDLMDETGLVDRRMWAALLGVTDKKVNQWLTDKAIPTSERLWVLVDVLRWSDLKNKEPLEQYEKIASLPATEV